MSLFSYRIKVYTDTLSTVVFLFIVSAREHHQHNIRAGEMAFYIESN